jgi:hypothetical protein
VNNTESKLITAVLQDKQIHVLLQANVENLLRTHGDIWNFIRLYFENNSSLPPSDLVREKFRDFDPVPGVGATKHHLEELQGEYLRDSLKDILRSAATDVQQGEGNKALENLITKTSELKKNTAAIRDIDVTDLESAIAYFENVKKQQELGHIGIKTGLPGLTTTYLLESCQGSWECSLHIQVLESRGWLSISLYRPGNRVVAH